MSDLIAIGYPDEATAEAAADEARRLAQDLIIEPDAIAVIVSEETGSISLAVSGTIERDLSVEQLRERLGELLRRYVPPSTLPTPISNGSKVLDEAEVESSRATLPRSADSRLDDSRLSEPRLNDSRLKQGTDR